jgi:hypothetical protein
VLPGFAGPYSRIAITLPDLNSNRARVHKLMHWERWNAGGYECRINFGVYGQPVAFRSAAGLGQQEE